MRPSMRVLDGDWSEMSGQRAVERWLRLKTSEGVRFDVVGCQNDSMAVGAGRALEAWRARPELARLPRTGCDRLPDGGRRLVDVRQLAATVITPFNTGPAIEMLARSLRSWQPPPAEILLPPTSYPGPGRARQAPAGELTTGITISRAGRGAPRPRPPASWCCRCRRGPRT